MPQRLFEVDNVVKLDDTAETGAAEERRVALVEIGRESGYATARSTIDALLRELGWKPDYAAVDNKTFVEGRAATFSVDGQPVGVLGEVHPEVLTNFGLTHPVALAEMTLKRVI
jgi:phenylalanyl-tRNA synthetase beta chain